MNLERKTIKLTQGEAEGVSIGLTPAPFVVASAPKGFVMCGYLSLEAADKLGAAAGVVRGVSSVDDLLAAPLQAVTLKGAELGLEKGMTGRDALEKLV